MARLISLVEDASPLLREVMAGLAPYAGNAHVVGITGSPGVGKSTSTTALVTALRAQDKRVGVLAVDPSSPFSGGALLGDRVRMQDHALDREVYIRSMASRGHLGGLSWATPQALRVLDAAGCDVILVETVGVGQSEVEIAGDGRHHAGAGRAGHGRRHPGGEGRDPGDRRPLRDQQGRPRRRRPGTPRAALDARAGRAPRGAWKPEILKTDRQQGRGHRRGGRGDRAAPRRTSTGSGELEQRRLRRARDEIEAIAVTALREQWRGVHENAALDELAAEVVAGESDPYAAADLLLESLENG